MASDGGGKIKLKRNQAPAKPYERSTSLFGKLKNSVKDLLTPSWLSRTSSDTDLIASTQDEKQVSTAVSNATEFVTKAGPSTSEKPLDSTQEQNDSGIISFPSHGQSSDRHLNAPSLDTSYGPAPNVNIATFHKLSDSINSKKFQPSLIPRLANRQHESNKEDAVRLRMSDSYIDDIDGQEPESTSVRPIMIFTGASRRNPESAKRQKLWEPQVARKGRPLEAPVTERPAFNSLLFGSPNQNDTSLFGGSLHESSFYSGKTRFGGASAERTKSLHTSLPYQSSLPLRKQVKANKLNTNLNATTSATAQRILETLDRISTPLGDAKKMPQTETANDSILSFTPSSYRRTSLLTTSGRPSSRPLQIPGPPKSQHQVASFAMIAKNRSKKYVTDQRQESNMTEETSLAVSVEPSLLNEKRGTSLVNTAAQSNFGTGKMKTKRFSQHVTNRIEDDEGVLEVPTLRTDFTLPITSINPISLNARFNSLPASSIPTTEKATTLKFTFSTPIEEKSRSRNSPLQNNMDKGFKFSSPIKASSAKFNAAGAEEGSKSSPEPAVGASSVVSASFAPSAPVWGSTAPKPKVASPDIGGTSSSFKSYNKWNDFEKNSDSSAASDVGSFGFSLAPSSSLKTGSVMDILGKTPSPSFTSATPPSTTGKPKEDDLMAKFKKPAGSWQCEMCMIYNKPDAAKCAACETPKPQAKGQPGTDDLMAKFKKPSGSWDCDKCKVSNKPDAGRCVACETPKPQAKQGQPGTTPVTDNLMAKFKKPAGTWECDTCMVPNKPDTTKCAACTTPRPGSKQDSKGSNFSSNNLSAMFKKPPGNWECSTCMVLNAATALRCIACDASKPGLETAGLVSNPTQTSSSALTIVPTGGFVINMPATTTTTVGSGGFKFGNTSAVSTSSVSLPASGFVFNQTLSSNSSGNGSSSVPVTGGFKFGVANSVTSETVSTLNSNETKLQGGFVFGTSSTSVNNGNNSSKGFHFNAATNNVDGSTTAVTGSQTSSINGTSDNTKSNTLSISGGIQFGNVPATTVNETNSSKNFSFSSPSSSVPTASTLSTIQHQSLESSTPKTVSNLFQFGASTAMAQSKITGLGMASNLSENKTLMNGGFGSGMGVLTAQAVQDGNKLGGFTSTPVFGSFGQSSSSALIPNLTTSQTSKHTLESEETDGPVAKKSVQFSTGGNESSSNGLFTFGAGGAPQKSAPFTFNANAPAGGGFVFGSNRPTPAQEGGFQFPASAPVSSFTFKAPSETSKIVLDSSIQQNKGPASFSITPNFNFGGASQLSSNTPFQFGAQPTVTSGQSSSLFSFGAASSNTTNPPVSGNFTSSGTGDRKIRKAVRRGVIKK